jgi:hypothetical protein
MSRYLVPDLSPQARPKLSKLRPKVLFVAESPHIHEVEPAVESERRPLCGAAGKAWWGTLTELLEGETNSDVSLKHLIEFCGDWDIAVMNAVQVPLDPKVMKRFPDADPLRHVGFSKEAGPSFYKKQKGTPQLERTLKNLRDRLSEKSVKDLPIVALGNDSDWFLRQALSSEEVERRLMSKLPHPSAWWRRGGLYEKQAREKLAEIFERTGIRG